jgi:transposase
MKTYRPWNPDRTYLLPPSVREWLPDDHIALWLIDLVGELDLRAIEEPIQAEDPRGEKPYSPRMMVTLLLYGYSTGLFSSRKLARATWTDVGARVIAAEQHPHFTTVNQFRLDHLEALNALFCQVLDMCAKAGLVNLGHVALDGTRIQANASKHKAMSYERMKKTEERLKKEVTDLLARAAEADAAEDATYGADNDGFSIPEELRRRETRLERIRKAREALEREAAEARRLALEEQAERARDAAAAASEPTEAAKLERRAQARDREASKVGKRGGVAIPGSQDGLPFHTVSHEADGTPKPKAQRNFTDPDSRIMHASGTYMQAYNAQLAVEETHQIIVAQALTNQGPDVQHLAPIVERIRENIGNYPDKVTADAGFWSEENAQYCAENGVDAYISTRRRCHEEPADGPSVPQQPINARSATALVMAAKVTSTTGGAIYAKRKWTVEPVFGEIKEARRFRRFSLRGLGKTRAEFSLVCTGHNLLKLWKYAEKK